MHLFTGLSDTIVFLKETKTIPFFKKPYSEYYMILKNENVLLTSYP